MQDMAVLTLPLVDPASVSDPTVRRVFAEIEQELGFGIVPNLFRALAGQPAVLRASWDLFRATVLQGRLPRIVKEMIGVVVSAANGSEYGLAVHLHSLGVQGLPGETLARLARGGVDDLDLAPGLCAILRLAHKGVHEGALAITVADRAAVYAEDVTREELAEVFSTISLFQYVNSCTDLARIPIDAI